MKENVSRLSESAGMSPPVTTPRLLTDLLDRTRL